MTRIKTLTAPKVGTVYHVVYSLPEREDGGNGAIVGLESVTEQWPTKKAARDRAKRLLQTNSDIRSIAISKPVEYIRPIDSYITE